MTSLFTPTLGGANSFGRGPWDFGVLLFFDPQSSTALAEEKRDPRFGTEVLPMDGFHTAHDYSGIQSRTRSDGDRHLLDFFLGRRKRELFFTGLW